MKEKWYCTDKDCLQYCKENSDGTFEFIEKSVMYMGRKMKQMRMRLLKTSLKNKRILEVFDESEIRRFWRSF